jgi:hypothetical protein
VEEDNLFEVLRSEVGLKKFLQTSDLKQFNSSKVPNSNELPLDVLMQRTLDTFEDVAVHLRRIPFAKGGQQLSPKEEETRKTVIVLGSGWAGMFLVLFARLNNLHLDLICQSKSLVLSYPSTCLDEGCRLPQDSFNCRVSRQPFCVSSNATIRSCWHS